MKKIMIGGGLSILCLLWGAILYNYKVIEQEGDLTKYNLYESENQNGYPMSNFGVSISNEKIMEGAELLEFVIENESAKEWYWRNYIKFNKESGEYTTDLEVKIDEVWYNIPLKKDNAKVSIPLMKFHLLPSSTTQIYVNADVYQTLEPGRYRFTIIIYDDNHNEFNLSSEFIIIEEE